jgi:tetratricopeptide (TPR) repeat protein
VTSPASLANPRPTRGREIWLGLLLAFAVLAAYWPAVSGGFIWDDDGHVTKPELRSLHGLREIWINVEATQQFYPVLHSFFWLEYQLWADNASAYHLTNILLHVGAACLVALVLRRLTVPGAWLAAGIFALHPVHVESVAWITEQKNTLSALFYLASLFVYLRFDARREFWCYLLALGLFIAGLLSKTVTATLPAALLVIFWWQRGRLSWRRDVAPLLPWFVLGAVAGIFTAWVERKLIGAEGVEFELSLFARCLLAGRVICFYLGKLFWPHDLTFIYPRWEVSAATGWPALFLLAVLMVGTGLWLIRRRSRAPLAGALFFTGTLFPVLGFFNIYPFIFSFVADHFQYVASLGIITPVAAGITCWLGKNSSRLRWLASAVPVALVGILGVLTWRQSHMYRDAETLYRTTIARNPACWLAYNNLGFELHLIGRDGESIPYFEQALRFAPTHAGAQNNLGVALAAVGRYREAIAPYEEAVRLRPDYSEAHHNLAVALANDNRAVAALSHYGQAMLIASHYSQVHTDWAFILGKAGRYEDAIKHCQEALRSRPDNAEAHNYWGTALVGARRLPEAIAHFEQALKINPRYLSALINLGRCYQETARTNDAVAVIERALRINPNDPVVLNQLGVALLTQSRTQEAAVRFEKAVRLAPEIAEYHYNLARSLQNSERRQEAADHYQRARELNPELPILFGTIGPSPRE